MKKQNKNVIENVELINLFDEYKQLSEDKNTISFEKLITTVLFKIKSGFESSQYSYLIENINLAKQKKYDFVFSDFVISFGIESKYGNESLVPIIKKAETNHAKSVDFSNSNNHEDISIFLRTLNDLINELFKQGKNVEIMPELIMYISNETNVYKLYFSKSWLAKVQNAIN
ncbi:MSC_0623 family F1-like ATPase-associated protein [Metamycoplasma spumans]|uniref:MSC_0623 family F1-like ATPase-associated protein n=1 Tax=Metamycoplasma spumans TaxID=92406 RepID=UPI0034DD756A